MKTALEKMLNAELEVHLGRGSGAAAAALGSLTEGASAKNPSETRTPRNRKNGFSKKTIQSDLRRFPVDVPRHRQRTFEPRAAEEGRPPGRSRQFFFTYPPFDGGDGAGKLGH